MITDKLKEAQEGIKETLREMHDSSKEQFGTPLQFAIFDKKVLVGYDHLLDTILSNPEYGVKEEDLKRYIDYGLLPAIHREDGNKGFPLYSSARAYFVHKLISKWGYDQKKLKIIIDYEEMLIDEILSSGEMEYSDLPPLDFYIQTLKQYIEFYSDQIEFHKKQTDLTYRQEEIEEDLKKKIDLYRANVDFLEKKIFNELPEGKRQKLEHAVFEIKWVEEHTRISLMKDYQARILAGFSPNVSVNNCAMFYSNKPLPDFIKLSEHPYRYQDESEVYLFGDWHYYPTSFGYDFFATPDFMVELNDGKIIVEIRDPQRVDSKYMRRIDKIYSIFRQKLDPPKARWGEKTGMKDRIKSRDRALRSIYRQLRKETPMASADGHLKKAMEAIFPEYGGISFETAKRVVYTTKSGAPKS